MKLEEESTIQSAIEACDKGKPEMQIDEDGIATRKYYMHILRRGTAIK